MKPKPRARKPSPKPVKKAPAKKASARKKPAAKTVARGPRRATAAKRSIVAKKPPARKVRGTRAATKVAPAKGRAGVATKKTVPPAKKSARRPSNGRRSSGKVPEVRVLTKREAWLMFDREARKKTGMTGKAFLEWWNRGEFEKDPDDIPGVMDVAMLLPFVEAS